MNNVMISIKIPAKFPMKLAAPNDASDRSKPINITFTMPASPPTNFTAKYRGRADKINAIITNNVCAAIIAAISIIFYVKENTNSY